MKEWKFRNEIYKIQAVFQYPHPSFSVSNNHPKYPSFPSVHYFQCSQVPLEIMRKQLVLDSFYIFLFKNEIASTFSVVCYAWILEHSCQLFCPVKRGGIPERGRVERSPCLPPGSSCPCLPQPGLCLPCMRMSTSPERDGRTDPPSWH